MAVKIRLRQQGCKNQQTYRLVACDTRVKRNGKYVEYLGFYNPLASGEAHAKINEEKTQYWLRLGAEMSEKAKYVIARAAPHIFKEWNEKKETKKVKIAARRRNARKKAVNITK